MGSPLFSLDILSKYLPICKNIWQTPNWRFVTLILSETCKKVDKNESLRMNNYQYTKLSIKFGGKLLQ